MDECGSERARQGHGATFRAKHVEHTAEELAGKPLAAKLGKHGGREQSDSVAGLGVQKPRNGMVLDVEFVDRYVLVFVMFVSSTSESAVPDVPSSRST